MTVLAAGLLALFVTLTVVVTIIVVAWWDRISAWCRRRPPIAQKSPEQMLQDAFAHKQKLDRDAQVEWAKDFYRLAGEDWNGPSREERRAANLATLRRQTVCQHKWAYVHMRGVMQMYCLTCGAKG